MTDEPRLSELLGATDKEAVLAEDFAYVVLKISDAIGYAEDGNWRNLHEKIGSLRAALATFDRKISQTAVDEDGEKFEAYRDPEVDAHRTVQLITAYAQQHGGRLGPTLFPIEKLDNEQAVTQIQAAQERTRRFHQELLGDSA
ncbi:hypothetical protein AB0I69_42580 [Streptomyces sp. NPDC050508]|uniref:hypothetical protein n=1 Tax=Streptomyces sp. NPDC050508 TaxID=3155405 RepID=UPI0034375BA8